MALSTHEQEILIAFTEEHFKDLPKNCIQLYKEEPRLPGYGRVNEGDDMLTMKVSLSLSLLTTYEKHMENKDEDFSIQLADLFAQEYTMHLADILFDTIATEEELINTSVPKLVRYCKMERNPIVICSPIVAEEFAKERGFQPSDITMVDMESGYLYEAGKIRNLTIVVDPLQNNVKYAYLITGNILQYNLINVDDESFVTYQLTEDGNDLLAIFKPVVMLYQVDSSGMYHKFFNIVDE